MKATTLLLASFFAAAIASADVTETFKQTYPLAPNGSVSVENINGNVEIIGWDKNEVQLEAEKKAKDQDTLERINLKIEVEPAKLSVRTIFEKTGGLLNWGNRGSVRYKLMVPANAGIVKVDTTNSKIIIRDFRGRVDAETTNGSISATGLAGKTDLESTNGSITAEFASLDSVEKVDIETTNGSITLTLPQNANARLHAETTNGRVKVEHPITISTSSKREIRGQIGTVGGPAIEVETTNGSITIK